MKFMYGLVLSLIVSTVTFAANVVPDTKHSVVDNANVIDVQSKERLEALAENISNDIS